MVEYDVVPHNGNWAVSINGVIYDSAAKFAKDFPKEEYGDKKFNSELGFSWQDIYNDMLVEWGL